MTHLHRFALPSALQAHVDKLLAKFDGSDPMVRNPHMRAITRWLDCHVDDTPLLEYDTDTLIAFIPESSIGDNLAGC